MRAGSSAPRMSPQSRTLPAPFHRSKAQRKRICSPDDKGELSRNFEACSVGPRAVHKYWSPSDESSSRIACHCCASVLNMFGSSLSFSCCCPDLPRR